MRYDRKINKEKASTDGDEEELRVRGKGIRSPFGREGGRDLLVWGTAEGMGGHCVRGRE